MANIYLMEVRYHNFDTDYSYNQFYASLYLRSFTCKDEMFLHILFKQQQNTLSPS